MWTKSTDRFLAVRAIRTGWLLVNRLIDRLATLRATRAREPRRTVRPILTVFTGDACVTTYVANVLVPI